MAHQSFTLCFSVCHVLSLSPRSVWRGLAALYVDGAELLQGALVSGGQAGIRQGGVPLPPAAAAGPSGAGVAGHGGAARRKGLQRRLHAVLLVHLLVHKLVSLEWGADQRRV